MLLLKHRKKEEYSFHKLDSRVPLDSDDSDMELDLTARQLFGENKLTRARTGHMTTNMSITPPMNSRKKRYQSHNNNNNSRYATNQERLFGSSDEDASEEEIYWFLFTSIEFIYIYRVYLQYWVYLYLLIFTGLLTYLHLLSWITSIEFYLLLSFTGLLLLSLSPSTMQV